MGMHLIEGQFQSDKYPTTPRGKVPLSVKDPMAQDLLWEYAQRRGKVDAEFAADLETSLRLAGFKPTERLFPIMRGPAIPWAVIEPCERQALHNHGQTIRRLAERGGLSPCEAIAVLTGVDWSEIPKRSLADDNATLLRIVRERTVIDVMLFCPSCGAQHLDAPEYDAGGHLRWSNPPHKSHLCHECQHIWRAADVPTNGVRQARTRGDKDTAL